MGRNIIEVEGISKRYKLGATVSHDTLRDLIAEGAGRFLKRGWGREAQKEDFWALRDVSFTVKEGEVVGIIGRNGAGKSTLLKILSRITEPTEGVARLKGRVASLLEVGTGFHPELTGRENIFLNGAILGMSRAEIKAKFDEIVSFSEIEKFLDTPVKRYSSGMYVRLAFAVAAHLEPEILIVDEVLAVGDAGFQKKCLGKMQDVSKGGRTVLFVSHNMAAVGEFCGSCMMLDGGEIKSNGNTKEVINAYLFANMDTSAGNIDLTAPGLRKNSLEESHFKWTKIKVKNSRGNITSTIGLGEPFSISLSGSFSHYVEDITLGLGVRAGTGITLFNTHFNYKSKKIGETSFEVSFDPNLFGPGIYFFGLGANGSNVVDWIPEAVTVTIEPVGENRAVKHNYDGIIIYPCNWIVET